MVSIIVPVYREEDIAEEAVRRLLELPANKEILVVDGDPQGSSIRRIANLGVECATSARGRATQLNVGAELARGDVLLFLHVDTVLPADAFEQIQAVLGDPAIAGGCFDLILRDTSPVTKLYSWFINLRARVSRIPVGDQAIFLRREVFERLGRYADLPILEEVDLMRRLKKEKLPIRISRRRVTVSARRFQEDGRIRRILINWLIVLLYYLRVSPRKLARLYRASKRDR